MAAHGAGQAHPAARQLLGDSGVAGRGDADLAPRLGYGETEDAELLHLLDQLLGIGVRVLELPRDGPDLPVDEVADDLDDRGLLRVELELLQVQHGTLPSQDSSQPAKRVIGEQQKSTVAAQSLNDT